jgi:hypothetical protein
MALKRAWKSAGIGLDQTTLMSWGRLKLVPRVQARSSRTAWVSKCTICPQPCTPASVRPAQITLIGSLATFDSACSSACWTLGTPLAWRCQPR